MNQYILFIRDEDYDWSKVSPDDMQKILEKYMAWSQELRAKGQHVSGEKLKDEGGRSLKVRAGGQIYTDGPYATSKEAIGGFYIIKAESYEHAVEIGKGCPCLTYGGSLEVREVHMF